MDSPSLILRQREVLHILLDNNRGDVVHVQLPLNRGQVLAHDCPVVPLDKVGQQLHRGLVGGDHGITEFYQSTGKHCLGMEAT